MVDSPRTLIGNSSICVSVCVCVCVLGLKLIRLCICVRTRVQVYVFMCTRASFNLAPAEPTLL